MIVNENLLNKIKDFGLNSYEVKLWVALLSRGISTAGELSDIANVPRSRSYDVLESLEKKGFIIMKIGKPIKYIAVKPEEVIEKVKKRISKDAKTKISIVEELNNSKLLNELSSLHREGIDKVEPTELTGLFKGRDNIYNHLKIMLKNAKNSVKIVTTSEGLNRKLKEFKSTLEKLNSKGVEIKITSPHTKDNQKLIQKFAKIATIKDIKSESRYIIIDDSQTLFMLTDDQETHPNYDTAVWVNSSYFAKTLVQLFDKEF